MDEWMIFGFKEFFFFGLLLIHQKESQRRSALEKIYRWKPNIGGL